MTSLLCRLQFALRASRGDDLPIHGDGTSHRSFLFVEDVAEAFDIVLHKVLVHSCPKCQSVSFGSFPATSGKSFNYTHQIKEVGKSSSVRCMSSNFFAVESRRQTCHRIRFVVWMAFVVHMSFV